MNFSNEQREEIDALIEAHDVTRKLSSGQKWDVAVLVASFLGGAVSLLGIAGYFVVVNAANISAERVAADVAPNEVADVLSDREEFLDRLREATIEVPTGAVLAFELEDGCPEGWSDFSLARGRMILGATPPDQEPLGLTRREFRERGGEETHTLTIAEMPRHNHNNKNFNRLLTADGRITVISADNGPPGREPNIGFDGNDEILAQGGDQPHNNMPPYIALYYCKKG